MTWTSSQKHTYPRTHSDGRDAFAKIGRHSLLHLFCNYSPHLSEPRSTFFPFLHSSPENVVLETQVDFTG